MNPHIYVLEPTDELHPVALLDAAKISARNNRSTAFHLVAWLFPTLPALLIYDLIEGRQEYITDGDKVTITWSGPLVTEDIYSTDWKGYSFVFDDPKLAWIEAVLDEKKIPHRRVQQDRRPQPRLEVPADRYEEAYKIQLYKITGNDKYVRDLPNDDPVFQEGGAAWVADLVDDDPLHRPITDDKNA